MKQIVTILHDTGNVVWHNVPKLRDIIIINPQWLADAMAGVVSHVYDFQRTSTAIVSSDTLRGFLKLKYD